MLQSSFINVTWWLIWFNRNRYLYNQCCKAPLSIAESVDRILDEYRAVQFRTSVNDISHIVQWTPPSDNVLKVNTDASYYALTRVTRLAGWLGAVGRD